MTRSKPVSDSEDSTSSEDGRKPKKKNKRSDSEDDEESEDQVEKKKDYKQIVLDVTREENEYRRQLYPDFHQVLQEDITCTSCHKDLKKDVLSGKSIHTHPRLSVLICKKCSEVHNDSDCDGLNCVWCKDNDVVFNCVSCTSQLCEDCVRKNLGKKALKDAEDDSWECILCNPRLLWKRRAKCWAAAEKAKVIRLKKNRAALNLLVEKRKMSPRRPVRRRANKPESVDKSGSSDDSEDSTEETSNKGSRGSVRTSEDSDVEDVYSSNGEKKQCVKRRKLRKNRRSSRSFSENKGDETEDSESGAEEKKNGGTPRSVVTRSKNLQITPKTNGTLASSSSDSSSEEDDARRRREKGGVEMITDDVLSVGEMLVDQIQKIKKKFKSAVTAGDKNAEALAIKKLVNVVKVGSASLVKIEADLSNLNKDDAVKEAAVNDAVMDSVNDAINDAITDSVNDAVTDSVNDAVTDSVNDAVTDSVNDAVMDSVNDAVNDAVTDSVNDAVNDAVTDSVNDAVSDSVNDAVSDSVNDAVNDAVTDSVNDAVNDAVMDTANDVVDDVVGKEVANDTIKDAAKAIIEDVNDMGDEAATQTDAKSDEDEAVADIFEEDTQVLPHSNEEEGSSEAAQTDDDSVPNGDIPGKDNEGVDGLKIPIIKIRRLSELMDSKQNESEAKEFDVSQDMFSEESVSLLKGVENSEEIELSPSLLANGSTLPSQSAVPKIDPQDNSSDESRGASPQPVEEPDSDAVDDPEPKAVEEPELKAIKEPKLKSVDEPEQDTDSDASSVNTDEVLAKKGLLDSSSDDSQDHSKKKKKKKKKMKRKLGVKKEKKDEEELARGSKRDKFKKGRKRSLYSSTFSWTSSESEEEISRGEKRPASSDDKASKKRKPCVDDIDVKNDPKLKAGCVVNVKKMSEQDLEEYLSALQEQYLDEDEDSKDSHRDRAIDRLGNLSTLRRKRRGKGSDEEEDVTENGDDDDDESNKSDKRKKERKPKAKEKGLMEFLDEEETGEQNSGNLDEMLDSAKEKSSQENGINVWNNMNKELLLQNSEDEDADSADSESQPEVKKKIKKEKVRPEDVKDEPMDEEAGPVEAVKEEAIKEEVDEENQEKSASDKDDAKRTSGDEKLKKEKKNWRKNRLLVGKLSDTDSDEGQAASQRKEERRAKEGSSEEERRLRAKKVRRTILKSDSDSDVKSTDKSSSDDTFSKKKKKKVSNASASDKSSSEVEEIKKKPKRRRIKVQNSSSDSSDDKNNEKTETPNKGRKKIRKVFKDSDLVEETKEAAKIEEERKKRIAERQKMYDEMYEALQTSAAAGQTVDKLVLDFDEKTKVPLVEVHPKIVEKLKPHQVKGIKFMWDACYESLERIKKTKGSGCILAHCMGLGKTFQVVALCHTVLKNSNCKTERILVVSPLSTVLNWCNEFDKWLKGLDDEDNEEVNVYNLTKQKKNYERQYQLKNWQETGGVMVLGYDMYRILSNPAGKKVRASITKTFQETLVDPGPDLVICDEGHLLKNEATALAKSMSRIKTLRRIVLTGTPLQNNLKEYHCMVQFVKPNLLGTRKEFLNRFVNPITNGQFEDSTDHDVRVMKRRAHVLHKMLEGSVQRYDYSVLTPFLPPKQEYVIAIRVSKLQETLYKHYLENLSRLSSGSEEDGVRTGRGVALFKDYQNLQRVWTHPLVLKWSSIKQEKEREKRAESDSEGSLRDFIDDDEASDTTPESSASSSPSDDDDIVCLDDDGKKGRKGKKKDSKTVGRRTRSSKKEESEEEVAVETSKQQEWWQQYVTDDHLDDLREGPKLVLLFAILKECEILGEKVLVFSQSLYSLDLIEHFLERIDSATQNDVDDEKLLNHRGSWTKTIDYFRLDGSTPTDLRATWCKAFNKETNSRGRLFLISTRAGGLGINLVAANRVIIFDASWNPSHDLQSIFRVYRFGQKRPVFVYRFLAQGTMEEKIYERQVTKLSLAGRVVDEHQIDRHYNMADLQELYRFTPHDGEKETPKLPKDRMFADMLKEHEQHIVSYHEHDSLLQNKADEELNEEERKEAWEDYEKEKKGMINSFGGVNPGIPTQADILSALKFTNPNMTDEQMRAILPQVLNDLYKINASNPNSMGQQLLNMQQQMMMRQQPRPNILTNYQPPKNLNYQQQQLYSYQQQMRSAQQYSQRAANLASYNRNQFLPTPNTSFVPMYPTSEDYRRAYGASFTNSMGFNQPSTSQGPVNRPTNTKVINIQTPTRK